jgi:gluconate 5-dehydrogenase
MNSIQGYNAIIVGGSRGIGQSLVSGFLEAKAKVTIFDVCTPEFEGDFSYIECDLASQLSIENALIQYHADNNVADVLVNCAAVTIPGESHSYSDSDWFKSLSVNLSGVFFLCRAVGAEMIKKDIKGSIINFTSIGAEQGFANNPGYAATKGGVKQLSKALAVEWGQYGIRVNNIVPGYTNTPMNSKSWNDKALRKERADNSVFGRWAEPEEMVGPAIFLASEASSFITGTDLVVDGGWLAKGM